MNLNYTNFMDPMTLYLVLLLETFSLALVLILFRTQFWQWQEIRWLLVGNLLGFLGLGTILLRQVVDPAFLVVATNWLIFAGFCAYTLASYAFWKTKPPLKFLAVLFGVLIFVTSWFTVAQPLTWARVAGFAVLTSLAVVVSGFPAMAKAADQGLARHFRRLSVVITAVAVLFFLRGLWAAYDRPQVLLSHSWASTGFLYAIIFLVFFYNLGFVYMILTRRNLSLEAVNRRNDQLFRLLGHDLRGPLGSYEECFEELAQQACYEPGEFEHTVTLFRASARQARELLESLLDWRTLSTGELRLQAAPLKLQDAVRSVFELLAPLAQKKDVGLENLTESEACVVVDRRALETIVRNLVSNAVKFSPPKAKVTVKTLTERGHTSLVIEDQGRGIPVEILARLNDNDRLPSQRGTAGEKGSGFGLVLCRQWAELAGLELNLSRGEEGGTCAILQGKSCP